MEKKLIKFGVAAKDYQNPIDAANDTYTTKFGQLVPTPLIFPANPYNDLVKKAKNILDLGCGVGRNLPWIMENTDADYVGVDPNESMLSKFWKVQEMQLNSPSKVGEYMRRVELFPDFSMLNKSDSFDVVVCTFVFQHIGFRPDVDQMNVADITRSVLNYCHEDTVWIMYEHDWEERWINRWCDELRIWPTVYIRDFAGIPELTHRGAHHLIIWKGIP